MSDGIMEAVMAVFSFITLTPADACSKSHSLKHSFSLTLSPSVSLAHSLTWVAIQTH